MPRTGVESAIPVGTQFSPGVLRLPEFLRALVAHSGNREAIKAAIFSPAVHIKRVAAPDGRTGNLPIEAAIQYGLLERGTHEATELTVRLAALPEEDLYPAFARHILLNLGGLRVVEAIEQMTLDKLRVTADDLAAYLTSQGFRMSEHNTGINSMRMWLAKAGVITKTWSVDSQRKAEVLGLDDNQIASLAGLDEGQRAFVEALCRLDPPNWIKAADVRNAAEVASGLRLGRGSTRNYTDPLVTAGLLEVSSGGTTAGKSNVLRTTAKFDRDVLQPFVQQTLKHLDSAVTAYYRKRPADIFGDLTSSDTHIKGKALEAFAIYIMRLLGLRFLHWNKRASTTGFGEVDAVLAGVFGGVATRWQVQCKNTPAGRVDSEDVQKEIGLLPLTKATHVLIIANCRITDDARRYARAINAETAASVYLLDGDDFAAVQANPASLAAILRGKAEAMLTNQPTESLWKT